MLEQKSKVVVVGGTIKPVAAPVAPKPVAPTASWPVYGARRAVDHDPITGRWSAGTGVIVAGLLAALVVGFAVARVV